MNETRRKLIFLWAYREWGGAQIYFLAIMKEAAADWDITVILPKDSSPEFIGFLREIDVNVELVDFYIDLGAAPTIVKKLKRQWSRIDAERRILKYLGLFDLKDSILHIETSPWQSWLFLRTLSRRGANVFVTLHNAPTAPSPARSALWQKRMRYVSRLPGFHIFTSNNDTKERIRNLVAPSFWENIAVTYTCVDPPQIDTVRNREIDKKSLRKQHGIDPEAFVVLCVGQFVDRKGRWVFLEAASKLRDAHPKVTFVWVAPHRLTSEEQARVDDFGLKESVKILLSADVGSTREDILTFFRVADIFALPSFIEGLPIALLEAMAIGLPSISTNVYAIPEAVKHLETGILIDAGDAESLAAEIVKLKEDRPLRELLSANGRKFVIGNFDERIASQIAISKYRECFADG